MKNLKLVLIALLAMLIFDNCSSQSEAVETLSTAEKISAYLQTIEQQGFHGTVLVDIKGKIEIAEGYGLSDRDKKISNTKGSIFDIGSITKQFTAAGILKLEMQGKLSVNDPMTKYFDNVPEDKKFITLHHLLTHSAGFPGAIGDDYEVISTEQFTDKAFASPLGFTPGSAYNYSNVGYTLLAMIIEKVSGTSYENYLNKHLFQPAGMQTTGYLLPKWNGQLITTGYQHDKRWAKPTEKWTSGNISWNLKGNGGILSTVEDMHKWHQALLSEDILSAAAKEKFYQPYVREGQGASSSYAYGWAVYPTPRNTHLITHNGGNGIFFADFLRYLEEEVTIILMCNQSTRYAQDIAWQIAGIIFKDDFAPTYPEGNNADLNEKAVEVLAQDFMNTIKSSEKSDWEEFIKKHCTEEFIDFASMEDHLGFFQSFHEDLGNIDPSSIDISNNVIQIVFETTDETVLTTLELEQTDDGAIKVGGLLVD